MTLGCRPGVTLESQSLVAHNQASLGSLEELPLPSLLSFPAVSQSIFPFFKPPTYPRSRVLRVTAPLM